MERKKVVIEVHFNWHEQRDGDWAGYDGDIVKLEDDNIDNIEYRQAQGEGDRHYCHIFYKNGVEKRVFNLKQVEWDYEGNI